MNDIAQEASSESLLSMWATGSCLDSDTAAGECYLSHRASDGDKYEEGQTWNCLCDDSFQDSKGGGGSTSCGGKILT